MALEHQMGIGHCPCRIKANPFLDLELGILDPKEAQCNVVQFSAVDIPYAEFIGTKAKLVLGFRTRKKALLGLKPSIPVVLEALIIEWHGPNFCKARTLGILAKAKPKIGTKLLGKITWPLY